uniref:URB1 ribosome biogenesis homolog n=1 Tax=Callorhinchus milii TaxID=7868 RepID=A0A4W3JRC6_CALMI
MMTTFVLPAGLETFISLAKQLPSSELYDVVEGYIKISVDCTEIFKLFEGERREESQMILIFEVLETILLRTASDLSHFSAVAMNIVKKLLHMHMKLMYVALYSANHRSVIQSCLNLMTAMVSQSPDAARDFFSQFDFNNKFLPGLVKKRDKKGKPDVRMAYIQFAISFLITGDNTTIIQVLELNDFITDIFTSGLKEDRISVINLLLSTLKTKVVRNKAITKTQKVRLFTPGILHHIASLFCWNGIVDVELKNSKDTQDTMATGEALVRELVHSFLMDLCCSLKHGITFYDPSLGTAGRLGNLVLLRFLVGLKTAAEDDLVSDLVVNILTVCPDLLNRFFKETRCSFVPRIKTAWLDNIKLLRKIYEAQPVVSKAYRTKVFVPIPRLISMVMVTTVPPVANKVMFAQGLNLPNKAVQHTTLSLLAFVLKRALKNIEHCLNEDEWENSEIYTPSVMKDVAQQYREAVGKLLPDMNNIVSSWQSLLKSEDKGEKRDEKQMKNVPADPEFLYPIAGADDIETTVLKALLLQVMCLYQKVVPHVVSQCTFDFSKLLKGIVSEDGVREEVPPILQHCILQLALELPANKFTWFRVQVKPSSGEKPVFYLLLKMFVTSQNPRLQVSTKQLIIKLLKDSGIFEHTWKELELWLQCLRSVSETEQETVVLFLERILIKLISNPYPHTDKTSDITQEAGMLQVNFSGQDSDSISMPISHIDDVLDMVDVIVENSEGLDEEIGFNLSKDMITQIFPFSPVVSVALETRNKIISANEAVLRYLAGTLTAILHVQLDPLALCLMLHAYDKELDSLPENQPPKSVLQLYKYYTRWIPERTKEVHPAPLAEAPFSVLLKDAYEKEGDVLVKNKTKEKLKEAIARLDKWELALAVKHLMLYIRTCVENFNKVCTEPLCYLGMITQNGVYGQKPRWGGGGVGALEDMLLSVFKHPTLEQWFLGLELQSLPPHSLNPVSLKMLSHQLNSGILSLLKLSTPNLLSLGRMDAVINYFKAVATSALKELEMIKNVAKKPRATGKQSLTLEALKDLHTYMDVPQLKEVVASMLQLPEESLTLRSTSEKGTDTVKQLSLYGRTLVKILTGNRQKVPEAGELALSCEHIRGVAVLLESSSSNEMERVLLDALEKEPIFAQMIRVELSVHCLNRMTTTSLSITAFLIRHSRTHLLQFELWCLDSGRVKHLQRNMDAYLSVLAAYLQYAGQSDTARPGRVFTNVLGILKKALWKKLLNAVVSNAASDQLEVQIEILSKLIQLSATQEDMGLYQIQVLLLLFSCFRWVLADAVTVAISRIAGDQDSWQKCLLKACVQWLINNWTSSKEQKQDMKETEEVMLTRLQELIVTHSLREDVPKSYNAGYRRKYRYGDVAFLVTLQKLMTVLYENADLAGMLIPLPTIHTMVTNHSLFLSTMLKATEDPDENLRTRDALVDVLLSLVKQCPSVCDSSHFTVLLGAYGATLSSTDRKLLLILQAYEKNNVSLSEFRLLLWGPAAVEHHKTRKSLGKSLWQQPSMDEILSLLDREKMFHTVLNFPQRRYIFPEGKELWLDYNIKDPHTLYDPCFLLPLFSSLITPESLVECSKFVDTHALGLTVAALSSYDPQMRAAAYHVLGNFYMHLEGARFREKRQLLYLLDMVKNGIQQPNVKFTFALAYFVAKVAQQMLKPEEHMYKKINNFLLSHQYLDLRKLPGFFRFFYSSDMEHKIEREWVLELLGNGLKDNHCYELCDHQKIFHVILAFFNSPLCGETAQNQIVRILLHTAHIPKGAYQLIRDHSLLSWILHNLQTKVLENRMLFNLISLLHTLWLTNLGKKEKTQKFLPLHFINEFLYILSANYINVNLTFSEFLHMFSSIIQHHSRALGAYKETGWITINESVLSHADMLLLLHKWSVVGKEAHTQDLLRTLAQKYGIKKLLSTSFDFYIQLNYFSISIELQESCLERCKESLRSIFAHWDPAYTEEKLDLQENQEDTGSIVKATTCLVVKWVIESAAESPMSIPQCLLVLKWLKRNVLPCKAVCLELVEDDAFRHCLLRLYSGFASTVDGEALRWEASYLFVGVLFQLCCTCSLSINTCHFYLGFTAAALFLLSIYLWDLWLGAQEAHLFLSHVRLISIFEERPGFGQQSLGGKSESEKPADGMVSLCRDISHLIKGRQLS